MPEKEDNFVLKICGLTRTRDARVANEAGATHLGCIFAPTSPRGVNIRFLEKLRREVEQYRARPKLVAVTAELPEEIYAELDGSGLADIIQAHDFTDRPDFFKGRQTSLWLVGRVRTPDSLTRLRELVEQRKFGTTMAENLLLDSWSADQYGGTGKSFQPEFLRGELSWLEKRGFILAGGLDTSFLEEQLAGGFSGLGRAIRGFDVSSGVEVTGRPGIKDATKIEAILEVMRKARRVLAGNESRE